MPTSTASNNQSTTQKPRILVVEDDVTLSDQLTELLLSSGYQVKQCFDGQQALDTAVIESFQLILLDLMLPGRDGLSLLQILRNCSSTPVIIVSAKHAEEERVKGLSAGADDYLAKPFNKDELLLRIDAILRRTMKINHREESTQQLDELIADRRQQQVSVGKEVVTVTPTELSLLWTLMQNAGEILSKAFLYQTVLNRRFSQYDRSLDMHFSRVRRKLNDAGWDGSRLQTIHGKGYRIT
ncbi:MAG: response regulator transcription factor [Pseudomonadota bacterium]